MHKTLFFSGETVRFWDAKKYRENNQIHDHADGSAHKAFVERVSPFIDEGSKMITLTLNADGVKIFADTKNKKSVWPFYLVINEIEKDYR